MDKKKIQKKTNESLLIIDCVRPALFMFSIEYSEKESNSFAPSDMITFVAAGGGGGIPFFLLNDMPLIFNA